MWAFVMVLSASRHMFVRPLLAMTLAAWIDAHVAAFAFFGGTPAGNASHVLEGADVAVQKRLLDLVQIGAVTPR